MDVATTELPVAFVVVDPDGVVLDANDLALRELGRDRNAVDGQRFTDLFTVDDASTIAVACAQALGGAQAPTPVRASVVGSVPPRHVSLAFRKTDDGVAVTIVEASEQRRAERIVAHMARMSLLVDLAARATWGPMGTYFEQSSGS